MFGRTIVQVWEFERGLLYHKGRFKELLEPGRYVLWPWQFRHIDRVDVRETSQTIQGQEILTKDKIGVRVTLVAQYKVADPVAALHNVESYVDQLYQDLQLTLREHITGRTIESSDAPTRTEYHLTEAGQDSLAIWLHDKQPSASMRSIRIEFLSRLYIANLLHAPSQPIIAAQKNACQRQLTLLQTQRNDTAPGTGLLALEFMIMQLEAVLQWLDHCDFSSQGDHNEAAS